MIAGNYLSRIDFDDWPLDEIGRQVEISREPQHRVRGSLGNVMFSAKMFRDNIEGTVDFFANYIYRHPALQPEYNWLASNFSSISNVTLEIRYRPDGGLYVNVDNMAAESMFINQIAIYKLIDSKWRVYKVLPMDEAATNKNVGLNLNKGSYVATLIDRFGREGRKNYFKV